MNPWNDPWNDSDPLPIEFHWETLKHVAAIIGLMLLICGTLVGISWGIN